MGDFVSNDTQNVIAARPVQYVAVKDNNPWTPHKQCCAENVILKNQKPTLSLNKLSHVIGKSLFDHIEVSLKKASY